MLGKIIAAGIAGYAATKITKTVINNASQAASRSMERQQAVQTYIAPVQPLPVAPVSAGGFCSMCGTRLDAGARFCSGCGAQVGVSAQPIPAVPAAAPGKTLTRQQEFAGVVVKCPNCGQIISNMDVICPSCGHQITGRAASSSVQQLQAGLMQIENSRRIPTGPLESLVYTSAKRAQDEKEIIKKKITLIGSFPIPNTIEEIAEFAILAAGNINVSLSKMTMGNKFDRWGVTDTADARGLSDAWVGKLQQAYQKAEMFFSDKPAFNRIRDVYESKMRELHIRLK